MKATITKTRIIFDEESTDKLNLQRCCVVGAWCGKSEKYLFLEVWTGSYGWLFSHLKNRSYVCLRNFLDQAKLGTKRNCAVSTRYRIIRIAYK